MCLGKSGESKLFMQEISTFLDTKLCVFTLLQAPTAHLHRACWAKGLSARLPQQSSKGAPLAREEYLAAQLVGTCRRHCGAVKELAVPGGEDSVNTRAECARGGGGGGNGETRAPRRQTNTSKN